MLFSLFAVTVLLISTVSADRTVVVLFNNGHPQVGSCDENDLTKTQAILTASGLNSTYGKRQLRAADVDDMTDAMLLPTDESHRSLWPRKCKSVCAGCAAGTCQESDCKGYRRRHLGTQGDRNLLSGAAFTCGQQVSYINNELTKLANSNQLSTKCKSFIMAPRNITCYDDVIYGVVEYFNLWDVASSPQKVLIEKYTGQDICRGRSVTFEAVTNDCVDFLLTSLTGPNDFYKENYELTRPFSVFGDIEGNYNGQVFSKLGQYELTALPDGFLDKKVTLRFNVVDRSVAAVKLWDTTTKNLLSSNFTGSNVCNTKFITFEAILSCANSIKMTLTSTSGYTKTTIEKSAPFSLFGDINGNFYGTKLQNGLYTLTIYPDEIASDGVKTIQFNVVTC